MYTRAQTTCQNTFAILDFGVLSLGHWIPLKFSIHPLLPGCASRCFSLCALLLESASIRALPPACAVLRCAILTCAVRGTWPRARCHMIFNQHLCGCYWASCLPRLR